MVATENTKDFVIGFILGATLYDALANREGLKYLQEELNLEQTTISVNTPFGAPSDKYFIGKTEVKSNNQSKDVKFLILPRHGRGYSIPPHEINHKANIIGFKSLGINQIVSFAPVWSLSDLTPNNKYKKGDMVLVTDYMNLYSTKSYTFFNGPTITHINCYPPYSKELQRCIAEVIKKTHRKAIIQSMEYQMK